MTGPADDHLAVWAGTRHGSLSPSQSISAPNPERWDVHGEHGRKDGTESVTGMMNAKLDAAFQAADALYARADAMQTGVWDDCGGMVGAWRKDALNGEPGPVRATIGVRRNGKGWEGYVAINGEPYWEPGTEWPTEERAKEHARSWQAKVKKDYVDYQRIKAENAARRGR